MPPFSITGGNIDPQVTPMRVQSVGGGGGSFFTAPIRFVDFEVVANYNAAQIVERLCGFSFTTFQAILNRRMDGDAIPPLGNTPVPDQPQWHDQAPIGGQGALFGAAWLSNEGGNRDLTQWDFASPPVSGVFTQLSAFGSRQAQLRVTSPGVVSQFQNVSIYQVSNWPNTQILAQATVTLTINFI